MLHNESDFATIFFSINIFIIQWICHNLVYSSENDFYHVLNLVYSSENDFLSCIESYSSISRWYWEPIQWILLLSPGEVNCVIYQWKIILPLEFLLSIKDLTALEFLLLFLFNWTNSLKIFLTSISIILDYCVGPCPSIISGFLIEITYT